MNRNFKTTEKEDDEIKYSVIYNKKQRLITFTGEVIEEMVPLFSSAMKLLENASNRPITIKLQTRGGDIDSGMNIIDTITQSKCDVKIIATGTVGSIGILILAAGDKRESSQFTSFVHHEDRLSFPEITPLSEIIKQVNQQIHQDDIRCKWLSDRTKLDFKTWKGLGIGEDFVFDAKKALEIGLIHKII